MNQHMYTTFGMGGCTSEQNMISPKNAESFAFGLVHLCSFFLFFLHKYPPDVLPKLCLLFSPPLLHSKTTPLEISQQEYHPKDFKVSGVCTCSFPEEFSVHSKR